MDSASRAGEGAGRGGRMKGKERKKGTEGIGEEAEREWEITHPLVMAKKCHRCAQNKQEA